MAPFSSQSLNQQQGAGEPCKIKSLCLCLQKAHAHGTSHPWGIWGQEFTRNTTGAAQSVLGEQASNVWREHLTGTKCQVAQSCESGCLPGGKREDLQWAGAQKSELLPTHMDALTWDKDTWAVLSHPQSHQGHTKLVPLEQQSD